MKDIKSLAQGWFNRRVRSMRDLYALGMLSIAPLGYSAAQTGVGGACLGVGGILAVLLLATLAEGGWFKKRGRGQPSAGAPPAVRVTTGTDIR